VGGPEAFGLYVEDVNVVELSGVGHPNLCLHLETQSVILGEQDGAPKATCEEQSASATKSKAKKRDIRTRTSVGVERTSMEKEGR